MKLILNSDLISKIGLAKRGFSLRKFGKSTLELGVISAALSGINSVWFNPDSDNDLVFPFLFSIAFACNCLYTFATAKPHKIVEEKYLRDLSFELLDECDGMDYESLLDAYTFQTKYRFVRYSFLPRIEQKKYIKVPFCDDRMVERETILVQKHIMGSGDYRLSFVQEEPGKAYVIKRNNVKDS